MTPNIGELFDAGSTDFAAWSPRLWEPLGVALVRIGSAVAAANELNERGIVLKSIKESIDYSTSVGRMLAGIFACLAE